MDIGELMRFKPATAPKRPAPESRESGRGGRDDEDDDDEDMDDPSESYESRAAKRRKRQAREAKRRRRQREEERMAALEAEAAAAVAVGAAGTGAASDEQGGDGLSEEQRREIRALLDRDEGAAEAMDETALKRLVLAFEKRATRNREMRVKHPDEPERFMESEVALHGAVQDLRALAAAPELYPLLAELGCAASFLGLLSHENADVSVAAVELVQELTDVDTLNESEEGAAALIDALIKEQVAALLVQNLDRLNESVKEEADGVHNTLSIFENLFEFRPEVCREAAEVGLLAWLVKKLKVKVAFDVNKLYASEILSIMLQSEPSNRRKVGEMGGAVDSLLQQLAYYKRHNPGSAEESEMMENLFDCFCSLMLHTPNRERFLRGEGLQLMNLMLREKKLSRNGALKVLDHALNGAEGRDNCHKFVDILGLRTIFPLFMKTPKRSKRKGVSAEEHEEHVVSVVAALVKNCRGAHKQRVMAKFVEADHEKVERLMELHFKYLDKVQAKGGSERNAEEDEDEAYLRRLDSGLFTLQLVDLILAESCASAPPSVKQRVLKILQQRKGSVTDVREVLREYAGNLGDGPGGGELDGENAENEQDGGGGGGSSRDAERQYILGLVDKF